MNVKVEHRPITNYGVQGVKTAGSYGPNRQIYDKTFYVTQMTKRNRDIVQEINKLRKEMEDLTKDNQTYLNLEKK